MITLTFLFVVAKVRYIHPASERARTVPSVELPDAFRIPTDPEFFKVTKTKTPLGDQVAL
jgi:hypothetical protein